MDRPQNLAHERRDARSSATPDHPSSEPANAARVFDWAGGGNLATAVDILFGEEMARIIPLARITGATLAFTTLRRHIAFEAGVRQILNLGCGLPTAPAWEHGIFPELHVRELLIDNDPIVIETRTASAPRDSRLPHPPPAADLLRADIRDTDTVLDTACRVLNLSEPVLLQATGVLDQLADQDEPGELIATYRGALAPGSHLAISHISIPEESAQAARLAEAQQKYADIGQPITARPRETIDGWLSGLQSLSIRQTEPFLHFAAGRVAAAPADEELA